MLSRTHAALRWWVQRTPALHQRILQLFGWQADGFVVDDPHVATPTNPQMAADAVVQLYRGSEPVGALLYEVQLAIVKDKPFAWLTYLGGASGNRALHVALCVVTIDSATWRWAEYAMPDDERAPYRYVAIGPDTWEHWARSDPDGDPSVEVIAWICGRALDLFEERFASHIERCARLDIDPQQRYFTLLRVALMKLPPDLAETLMNQPPTREMFFPFHPREFEAFEQGEAAGMEQGVELGRVSRDTELAPELLATLQTLDPQRAATLQGETDVKVLMAAIRDAAAGRAAR